MAPTVENLPRAFNYRHVLDEEPTKGTFYFCLSSTSVYSYFLSIEVNSTGRNVKLTDAKLGNHETVIEKLRERCNAGRNRHVWHQQFPLSKQRAYQAADNWLCDLRELARKCEFDVDCCANLQPTRILGQLVYRVYDDEIRRKLLEKGASLSLDQAIEILRVAEAVSQQATNLKSGDAAAIQALPKSSYKKGKRSTQQYAGRKVTSVNQSKQLFTFYKGSGNQCFRNQLKQYLECFQRVILTTSSMQSRRSLRKI
jgi:hypothetical protein